MSATMTTETLCPGCNAERPADRRLPCPKCNKRPRDIKPAAVEDRIEAADLVVVASNPQEMVTAQQQMIASLDGKIAAAEKELAEAQAAGDKLAVPEQESETAKMLMARAGERLEAQGRRLVATAQRRLVYLQKVRAALAAGYVMMPNFPGHVIAIRTARQRPAGAAWLFDVSRNHTVAPAKADPALPPGEGNYVAPIPEHARSSGNDKVDIHIQGWDEEIALPVEFLKPVVVERTARAIDLRIFDEIVLVRDGESRDTFAGQSNPPRGRDPLVVGRIILRTPNQKYRHERRVLSFLIAWFMDTRLILDPARVLP